MDIKTEIKTVFETTAYFEDGILKTHNCELYREYGEEKCQLVSFDKELEKVKMANGRYKITVTVELEEAL